MVEKATNAAYCYVKGVWGLDKTGNGALPLRKECTEKKDRFVKRKSACDPKPQKTTGRKHVGTSRSLSSMSSSEETTNNFL